MDKLPNDTKNWPTWFMDAPTLRRLSVDHLQFLLSLLNHLRPVVTQPILDQRGRTNKQTERRRQH